ncbi:hypothetical protein LTR84_000533 [Exophiala bonariae]|uniref:Suppressor protein SRP40 n=1 Tax=Exophiala bonariae TaxID=1690606 RepID=A0AAV9NSL6_9EURO|nr:hypothetical protein LTR84_000533 [Exophiala bonariae]
MREDFTRLHITPLNPDLLPIILGPNLVNSAANISFNTIPTFPENNYGYLDLPVMDAERIKKKVNGAILKGKKIKVEEARPNKRRRIEESTERTSPTESGAEAKKSEISEKEKKQFNVIAGHELPAERKVKRGWTEVAKSKSAKLRKGETKVPASKYSDKEELLFRTKLPQNRSDGLGSGKEKEKIKRKKSGDVVHEFARSSKQPSFLRDNVGLGIKGHLEYMEGQGWVNEAGEVIEPEPERVSRLRQTTASVTRSKPSAAKMPQRSPSPPSSQSSDKDEDSSSQGSQEENNSLPVNEQDDETSSSGSSSISDSDADQSVSKGEANDSDIEQKGTPALDEVHPLEALFKKPKKPTSQDIAKPSLEVSTSFSFFDAQAGDEIDQESRVPGTPFSSQDVRSRGLRSAAPTPDTAYPSRFNSYGSTGLPGDEVDEDDEEEDSRKAVGSKRGQSSTKAAAETPSQNQSDFEKKFWENRGENSRAWKQRRRTVLKEKRQRENRVRRPKNW